MAQHLRTAYQDSLARDRERAKRQRELQRCERKIEQAQAELLALIAEVGPRNAVVLLNDGLRTALDLLDRDGA